METVLLLILLLLLTLLLTVVPLVFFLEVFGWSMTGVPYLPTRKKIIEKISELAILSDDSVFYDLGCGDGNVLFALSKTYPHARFIGVEKAPLPYCIARVRRMFSKARNVEIRQGDIYSTPINDATHVFLYLFSKPMERLLPKCEQELKPGAVVFSCDFQFKKKNPVNQYECGTSTLFVYQF